MQRWSDADQRRIVEESGAPGMKAAAVARRNDVSANLLFVVAAASAILLEALSRFGGRTDIRCAKTSGVRDREPVPVVRHALAQHLEQ